jgi:transposase
MDAHRHVYCLRSTSSSAAVRCCLALCGDVWYRQDYCISCEQLLSPSERRNRRRTCSSCCTKIHVASAPVPASDSSSPSPSPPPLFSREPGIHLPLSPIERAAAVTLTRIGETQQQAAERLGTTRQTVAHWQHTFEETRGIKNALKSGRPRETSEDENINIITTSVIDHYLTPRQILQELQLNVSAHTIDRRLQEAGLFGRVALKKRVFVEADKKKRLSFAEGYKNWTEKQWERVLFADEAVIQGEGGMKGGRQWVRRPIGTSDAFKSEYVHHSISHPKQLNIWACFSASGLGYCYIYNETLDAKSFVHILDTHLLPSADLLFTETPRRQWWYLQDNAPTHTARMTRKWLHNHGIICLDFPPYSPDLNPIENLWQHIEKRVEERVPTTIDELQDVVAEEWKNTPIELLTKLAHSMIYRCKTVIAAHGDHTHH